MWRTSEVFLILAACMLSENLVVCIFVTLQRFLMENMSMQQLSRLMKIMILYLTIPMIGMVGLLIWVLTIQMGIPIKSGDFFRFYSAQKLSLSRLKNLEGQEAVICLTIAWIIGMVYFGVIRSMRENRVLKKLEKICDAEGCTDLGSLQEKLLKELGLVRRIQIYISDIVPSPFMMGLFHPKIMLPRADYEEDELYLILKHELIHCRKWDYLYRRVVFCLCSVYWFNPAVYHLARLFVDVNEMACDEKVLEKGTKKDRLCYAKLIVRMAKDNSVFEHAVGLTGCGESTFERRVRNMTKQKKKAKKLLVGGLVMAMVLLCPLSALAASASVIAAQDGLVKEYVKQGVREVEADEEKAEFGQEFPVSKAAARVSVSPKGITELDFDIPKKGSAVGETIELSKGNKFHVYLCADNASDSFTVALLEPDGGRRYVVSVDGVVDHTFTLNMDGSYELLIMNDTNAIIHLQGVVHINN